jgi:Male gamete fusion factor
MRKYDVESFWCGGANANIPLLYCIPSAKCRGFRYQTMRCDRPVGSCLGNQLYQLGLADEERIAQGLEPLYNITRYGGGSLNTRQVSASTGGGGLALRLPLKGVKTSLVTLEIVADNVTLVVNRAPAKIITSEVCTFDGVVCGGFQAIATRGFLHVAVQNMGTVAAEFRASVTECSEGVLPVQEEIAAIGAGASYNFTFDLFMETDQAGNRSCSVVITDAEGGIADATTVMFYTNATGYEQPPDQSDLGDKVRCL